MSAVSQRSSSNFAKNEHNFFLLEAFCSKWYPYVLYLLLVFLSSSAYCVFFARVKNVYLILLYVFLILLDIVFFTACFGDLLLLTTSKVLELFDLGGFSDEFLRWVEWNDKQAVEQQVQSRQLKLQNHFFSANNVLKKETKTLLDLHSTNPI